MVYGQEAIVIVEFIVPNLFIAQATKMTYDESIMERLQELWEMDEERFLVDFHQTIEKE